MADRIGQILGNYRLTRLLGRGGFAEVYLGEHIHLGTKAAIKVLNVGPEISEQRYFLNEARQLATLQQPNIERVFEYGVANTTPYLVTEYAPEGTLRNRHPRGSLLNLAQSVSYTKQIGSALQYMHEYNIIHRDVKPENMLLRANGEVVLSDPGIAMLTFDSSLSATTITRGSEITGDANYIAPEQILGKPVRASDQYSLAIVAYEWLAGRTPFRGTSNVDIRIKQMNEPPPSLRAINPTIPRDVEEVVMTALAKDPRQRFASVKAFATAFEQAANLSPEVQTSPSSKAGPAALPSWLQPASSLQSAPPAPEFPTEIDPDSKPLPSLPPESPYQQPPSILPGWRMPAQQQSQQVSWGLHASGAGTPSPKETPSATPPPASSAKPAYGSALENTGTFQRLPISGREFPETPPLASRRSSTTNGLGNVLKKIIPGRKDNRQQAKELSLFAIARTTVDDTNRAIVGNTYTVEAGISQNSPEGFRGEPIKVRTQNAVDPLLFDVLIHPGDTIELMGTRYQRLRYNPGSTEAQFVTCRFRLNAPGRGQLIVHFYRERQWLKAIRFEFEGILQPQSAAATSGG